MRKMVVLDAGEGKELEERMNLIDPFDGYATPYKFKRQEVTSPRVLELLNYRVSKERE